MVPSRQDYSHVETADQEGRARVWVVLGTILVCILVLIYYATVYMKYGGVRRSADLRRVRDKGVGAYFKKALGREKSKAY